jgi:hypothetical protein
LAEVAVADVVFSAEGAAKELAGLLDGKTEAGRTGLKDSRPMGLVAVRDTDDVSR